MLLAVVFRHIIYVELMELSITLGNHTSWKDAVYSIDFVHLLEGETIQISIVCDQEGRCLAC